MALVLPYKPRNTHLGQVGTQDVLRDALDELLPQPLGEIRKAEKEQRVQVREALSPLHENGSFPNPYNIPEEVVDHLVTEADVGVSMIVERLLLTAVPQRSAVRAELRRQVARRLLRED